MTIKCAVQSCNNILTDIEMKNNRFDVECNNDLFKVYLSKHPYALSVCDKCKNFILEDKFRNVSFSSNKGE